MTSRRRATLEAELRANVQAIEYGLSRVEHRRLGKPMPKENEVAALGAIVRANEAELQQEAGNRLLASQRFTRGSLR
jgi:hypothetical protein